MGTLLLICGVHVMFSLVLNRRLTVLRCADADTVFQTKPRFRTKFLHSSRSEALPGLSLR
jgi:hypothetical protein